MAFSLPPLPYDYSALEPHIDTQTMQIHHDKHHAAYVTNANTALESYTDLQQHSAEDLLKNLNDVPEAIRTAVRNNVGGHVNHTMFWEIMGPNADGKLQVISTANQDSPLMDGHTPILGVDVWEHAYYLKYQNLRPKYLEAWWNTVNWSAVAQRFGR